MFYNYMFILLRLFSNFNLMYLNCSVYSAFDVRRLVFDFILFLSTVAVNLDDISRIVKVFFMVELSFIR